MCLPQRHRLPPTGQAAPWLGTALLPVVPGKGTGRFLGETASSAGPPGSAQAPHRVRRASPESGHLQLGDQGQGVNSCSWSGPVGDQELVQGPHRHLPLLQQTQPSG